MTELGDRLAELLPAELGAPDAVSRLVEAGVGLGVLGGLLALLPMTLYGEGLRRALLRFSDRREGMTGWRGRLAALPVLVAAPVLLYPLLLTVPVMADLARDGGTLRPPWAGSRSASTGCWPRSRCRWRGASGWSAPDGSGGAR